MKTLNPGILRVLAKVGSTSLIFRRVGGISARRARSENWALTLLHPKNISVPNSKHCETACGNDSPFKMIVEGLDGVFEIASVKLKYDHDNGYC